MSTRPRLLIEDWLPAAAIGVECMREEGSLSAKPPTKYFHVWWARRPLTASRAAVLGSVLPAAFPHDVFERLIGFARPSAELVTIRRALDTKRPGTRVETGFDCERAFRRSPREDDLEKAHEATRKLWAQQVAVIDPMSGGGSIPLEAATYGFRTFANEYNAVACSILEATVDYPFRFGARISSLAAEWAEKWESAVAPRLGPYYHEPPLRGVRDYVLVRTVPCPDTEGHPHTPLVPDWHLLKPKDSLVRVWAEPIVDKGTGTWTVRIVDNREQKARGKNPPAPTYADGKGISLFSGQQIPDAWIKAKAQAGEMGAVLYAVVVKLNTMRFEPPSEEDFEALKKAERAVAKARQRWQEEDIIPSEKYPEVTTDERPRIYGMPTWADMFSPRQLLCAAILVEELRRLRQQILQKHGDQVGEAVYHLLTFGLDKFVNHNCLMTRWESTRGTVKGKMDRHDFAFKPTFAELSPSGQGCGLNWSVGNVLKAYKEICELVQSAPKNTVTITMGSAASLPTIQDKSMTAVVVDPPYADNVQYSELADFFYVWLKRTQGHRRPEWFSSYLCDHTEEAVVNIPRHRADGEKAADARHKAHAFYQRLMAETFAECRRILCDNGALTVMFTHKKQEAWEALFTSLVKAGFTITATWPVKTESEHSLHQAKKNAAQSTVILVARKRDPQAEVGYFDDTMRREIRLAAQKTAERLMKDGLNPVDQLVGSFGPAMEVYSRHSEVRTDTGETVGVDRALDEASEAVAAFRIRQLAARGLQEVEAEGRFYLLCWDVLQAAEFRFNEAHLLGKAVGMDVDTMVYAGLVSKSCDKIKILSAKDRRRGKKLEQEEIEETLFGALPTGKKKRVKKGDVLKVHPNDQHFRTALDACHALALRFGEAGGGNPGIGSARQLATQQGWKSGSPAARLMEALLKATPPALWHEAGKKSAAALYPEFRAWHAMIEPLFGIMPPEWPETKQDVELALEYKDEPEEEAEEEAEGDEAKE